MVSSRCGADKESAVADGVVVEALLFYRVEDVVSVMFVLAYGLGFFGVLCMLLLLRKYQY